MSVSVAEQTVTLIVEEPGSAQIHVSAPTPVVLTEAVVGPQGTPGPQGPQGPQGPPVSLPSEYTDPVDSVLLFENALV